MKKILTSLMLGLLSISVAVAELPEGEVSIFEVLSLTEGAPKNVEGGQSFQFLGPGSGWGNMANLDLSEYKTLVLNFTYDASDAGSQVAVRFNINATAEVTNVKLHIITLPSTGTNYSAKIDLSQYASGAGEIFMGGLVFYAGATHWSFTYSGTPIVNPIDVEYIAVSKTPVATTGVKRVNAVNPNAKVDVLSITGAVIRKNVRVSEATNGLKPGIYLVGGQKVVVNKQ